MLGEGHGAVRLVEKPYRQGLAQLEVVPAFEFQQLADQVGPLVGPDPDGPVNRSLLGGFGLVDESARQVQQVARVQTNFAHRSPELFARHRSAFVQTGRQRLPGAVNPPPLGTFHLQHEHFVGIEMRQKSLRAGRREIDVDAGWKAEPGLDPVAQPRRGGPVVLGEVEGQRFAFAVRAIQPVDVRGLLALDVMHAAGVGRPVGAGNLELSVAQLVKSNNRVDVAQAKQRRVVIGLITLDDQGLALPVRPLEHGRGYRMNKPLEVVFVHAVVPDAWCRARRSGPG